MPDRTEADLAREAEAEAEAAEARADAARARAEELRRKLAARDGPDSVPGATSELDPTPRPRRPLPTTLAAGAAVLMAVALLVATGAMIWQGRQIAAQNQRAAEYAAAARQGVINLMSIDYSSAQDSVQRVLDGSTGRFRDNFAETAEDFVTALQDEKIVTKASVNDAAVESMTADSAVVLVSASSRREGKQVPEDQQQPRLWRVVLNLVREGGQIKMSGVEFV